MLRKLPLLPLDEATAAPFGKVIGPAPIAGSLTADARDLDFQCDGRAQLTMRRYPFGPLRCSVFERHHHVGQGFLVLEGGAAVAILAPATPGRDRPRPEQVTALLLSPGTGILIHRGVWHTLDRFAVAPPGATALLLTERETTADFIGRGQGGRLERSDVVDLKALEDVEFEVSLP